MQNPACKSPSIIIKSPLTPLCQRGGNTPLNPLLIEGKKFPLFQSGTIQIPLFSKEGLGEIFRVIVVSLLPLLLLLLFPLSSHAADKVIMKVYLNTEDKGERIFILTPENIALFPLKELLDMGFNDPPKETEVDVEGERYISLNKFSGVSVEINEEESALHITAEPKLLKKHIIDLAYKSPKGVSHIRDNSAFLNYNLDYLMGDDFDFKSLAVPLEMGVNINGYFGYSNFSYTKTDTDEKFVRLMTSITKDDPKRLRRYILGDFSASSGGLG